MNFANVTPIPIGFYFSERYRRSREKVNKGGAHYIGHVSMVPNRGDYYVLEQYHGGSHVLVHGKDDKYRILSNVCRHRQARMLPNDRLGIRGNLRGGAITCPIHFWAYDLCGKHVRAPEFDTDVRVDLPAKELQVVNGMLFDTESDIASELETLGHTGKFDTDLLNMSNYHFIEGGRDIVSYNFSMEKFMEVYQDVRHVAPFHPKTFDAFVDCNTLEWEFGENWSVQIVDYKRKGKRVGESYNKAHELVSEIYEGKDPPHGSLWFAHYPGLMIEWYPHLLTVSMLIHAGSASCVNVVDYFVHKDFRKHEKKILELGRHAYDESAQEDAVICEREQEGIRMLWESGDHFSGPYHPYEELGVGHYFDYLHRQHGPTVGRDEIIDVFQSQASVSSISSTHTKKVAGSS